MEQKAPRREVRRRRWTGGAGATLLFGLLLGVGFAWGTIAGDPGNSVSLAHGRKPTAATNAVGEVLILWESPEAGLSGQFIDPWGLFRGKEFPIGDLHGSEREPALTRLDDEEVAIVWESGLARRPSVRFRQFRKSLAGTRFLVPSSPEVEISDAVHPAVAAAEGNIALVWTAAEAQMGQHYLALLEEEDEPLARRSLAGTQLRIGQPGAATPADVAMANDGELLVVWENAGRDIMAFAMNATDLPETRQKGGRSLAGTQFRINESLSGEQTAPAVATTLDGNFLVVWETMQANGERSLYGRRIVERSLAGSLFRIDDDSSVTALDPSLAADPWGRQIVTWSQVDHSGAAAIMARSLLLDGTANGPVFRVDPGDPFPGAARVTRGGESTDFVVLWENDDMSENPDIRVRFLTGPYDQR